MTEFRSMGTRYTQFLFMLAVLFSLVVAAIGSGSSISTVSAGEFIDIFGLRVVFTPRAFVTVSISYVLIVMFIRR